MFKKLSMYVFIILIFIIPIASYIEKDSDISILLNSSLQQLPEIDKEKTANELITEYQQYVEDQFVGHEKIFKFRYIMDYFLRINGVAKYYFIPDLNMSYRYEFQVITEPAYIKGFDDVCENNKDTNFLYYVVPSKRVYTPDEYIKYDYNQNSLEYRQAMINSNLDMYDCVNTTYNTDVLKLTDYYNYDHHYNSKGVFKVYKDLINNYNQLFNYNYKPLEVKDLKEVNVSSELYLNDLFNKVIQNYTTEVMPKNAKVGEGNSYQMIGYERKAIYENPDAEGGKILFITDSYGQGMLPYLTENFSTVESIDFYLYAAHPNLLEEEFVLSDYDTVLIYTYDNAVYQNQAFDITY